MKVFSALMSFIDNRMPVEFMLNRKGLFIIGCARSGTTVMHDIVLYSENAYVGTEYNVHIMAADDHEGRPDPSQPDTANYLRRKQEQVPDPDYRAAIMGQHNPDLNWQAFLKANGKGRRYVGDKIAVGPLSYNGKPEAYVLQDFLETVPGATVIATIRAPGANLRSMDTMFQICTPRELMRVWMQSFEICLNQSVNKNKGFIVFQDEISVNSSKGFKHVFDIISFVSQKKLSKDAVKTQISDEDYKNTLNDKDDIALFESLCGFYEELSALRRGNTAPHGLWRARDLGLPALKALAERVKAFNAAHFA